jgi:UDP-galactopyranose mutase
MFSRMLQHPLIDLELGTRFQDLPASVRWRRMVYTGPIDEFFSFRFGRLPYRSLRFEHRTVDSEWHQPVAVVNYPGGEPYTRITEYKHLTGQRHPKTSITIEHPSATGDPYYPIPREPNARLYEKYRDLARQTHDVHFVGRLATYRYYNMDQVVGQALAEFRRIEASLPLFSEKRGTVRRAISPELSLPD